MLNYGNVFHSPPSSFSARSVLLSFFLRILGETESTRPPALIGYCGDFESFNPLGTHEFFAALPVSEDDLLFFPPSITETDLPYEFLFWVGLFLTADERFQCDLLSADLLRRLVFRSDDS